MAKSILAFCTLTFILGASAFAQSQPTISESGQVNWGADVQAALNESRWKGFKLLSLADFHANVQGFVDEGQAPMAMIEDLNSDRRDDIVVMGVSGRTIVVLAIISVGKKYKVVEVSTRESMDDKDNTEFISAGVTTVNRKRVTTVRIESLNNGIIGELYWNGSEFALKSPRG